jgi:hypothetical protein
MAATRKHGKKHSRKVSHKGGRKGTRKASKWTMFVKKIYGELKRKNKDASLGEAMKEASRRKSEM